MVCLVCGVDREAGMLNYSICPSLAQLSASLALGLAPRPSNYPQPESSPRLPKLDGTWGLLKVVGRCWLVPIKWYLESS